MTGVDWSELTYRTAAKLGRLTSTMSRSDIDKQAEQLAGKWKNYNDDPTPGKEYAVGRGAHTPVPAGSGIAWDVHVPPKTTKAPKVQKSWLRSVGPKNPRDYDSDDPYRPGGPLAIRQAERFARRHTELSKYPGAQLSRDAKVWTDHKPKCDKAEDCGCPKRYQPEWCAEGKCWEQFTRQPRNTRPEDQEDDEADHADPKPIYSGKRSLSDEVNTMKPDTWNVSANWMSKGQFLPGIRWSQLNTQCLVCGGDLPEDRRKYHRGECARIGANAGRRSKRRRAWPRDERGWYLQSPPSPRRRHTKAHTYGDYEGRATHTVSRDYRLRGPWAGEPYSWKIAKPEPMLAAAFQLCRREERHIEKWSISYISMEGTTTQSPYPATDDDSTPSHPRWQENLALRPRP
jgi:hypothetical protein